MLPAMKVNAPLTRLKKLEFLYGTAWKEDETVASVLAAIEVGFRAIDTANQRKHYFEAGVGDALAAAYAHKGLKREDFFLQSKFTFARGQDHRKPYDEGAPIAEQVQQSLASTLEHLRCTYLDSYVLHGPSTGQGLAKADWEAWKAMEAIAANGKAKKLGISNVNLEQLKALHEGAEIKPAFVQNRCFAESLWDKEIRTYCEGAEIRYQGFSLLTANWRFLGGHVKRPPNRNVPQFIFSARDACATSLHDVLEATGKSVQQVIFRFAQQVGMIPLIGSRDEGHLRESFAINDFSLTPPQLLAIERLAISSTS